jgi:hypothetical protein
MVWPSPLRSRAPVPVNLVEYKRLAMATGVVPPAPQKPPVTHGIDITTSKVKFRVRLK